MNNLLEDQLRKMQNVWFKVDGEVVKTVDKLIEIVDNNDSKSLAFDIIESSKNKLEVGKYFKITLSRWMLQKSEFNDRWNHNNLVPSIVIYARILKITDNMIYVDACKNEDMLTKDWSGWISLKFVLDMEGLDDE